MSELIQQSLESALAHHQAGRLQEAEVIYRQILSLAPEHPDALHLLGAIALKAGQYEPAIQLFRRAIKSNPTTPQYFSNLGRALARSNRTNEAIEAFRQALTLNPDLAEIHVNLGALLQSKGDFQSALASYRQATIVKPNYPDAHNCLGNAYQVASEFGLAAEAYRKALLIRPDYPEVHNNLGCALRMMGEMDAAIAEFRIALHSKPDSERFAIHLAETLKQAGQTEAADEAYRHALSLKPVEPETNCSLGEWLHSNGDYDQAIEVCRKALAVRPSFDQAWINLGNSLKAKAQFDEAAGAYSRAIAIQPDNAVAHFNLSIVLLLQGHYSEGWREHEWRWRVKQFGGGQEFALPAWDGSDLAGRRMLLYTEQGFGDTIQFARYIPLVAQRCGPSGKVFLLCEPQVAPLLSGIEGIEKIIIESEPLPNFDASCALPSLPLRFDTTLQTIPSDIPYLRADPQRAAKWKSRLAGETKYKVGLVWSGGDLFPDNRTRSPNLNQYAALAGIEGVQFYSLQKGPAAEQLTNAPAGLNLIDWTNELHDFADTAALIDNLDLVISSDTSIVHLAGALGKPIWTLLQFVADWRWLLDRSDSPWYPTMRLFRQAASGDWAGVVQEVSKALREKL